DRAVALVSEHFDVTGHEAASFGCARGAHGAPPSTPGWRTRLRTFVVGELYDTRDGRDEIRRFDRLGEVRLVPGAEGARTILGARIRRECDRGDAAARAFRLPHPLQQLVAVEVGQADVAD